MTPDTNAPLTILTQATGAEYPFRRTGPASRREQGYLDAASGFQGLDFPAGGLPGPMMAGPPYTVKDGGARFHAVKTARHAHDRMEERTPFHRSYADQLQLAVDMLGLPKGPYHLPLRGKDGAVAGYAQFKGVANRETPVLATVLAPHMKPGGENLERRLKMGAEPESNTDPASAGLFDTDHLEPRPPEGLAWNRRHRHLGGSEPARYALRRAFDGVDTRPRDEVIESAAVPGATPDVS